MLRANLKNQYRSKAGNLTFAYKVTGTTAEIEDYRTTQAAATNKTPDEWPKDDDGSPLFFVNVDGLLRNGQLPEKVLTLIKNRAGDRYFVDNTVQKLNEFEQVRAAKIEAAGKLLAEKEYGVKQTRTVTAPVPTAPEPAGAPAAPASVIEEMQQQVQAGTEHPIEQGALADNE